MGDFSLSPEGDAFIEAELARYETPRSAIIPCLYRIQKEKGYITVSAVRYLSEKMKLPEVWIQEALQFYTLLNEKDMGKCHVQVCCNVSCSMNGGREMADYICKAFGVEYGEVSADGKVSVSRVECLGSCDTGPMMQVNDKYYENLSPESAVEIIKKLGD